MATAQCANSAGFPGLHGGLTLEDLRSSRNMYNTLLSDEQQPGVETHLHGLGEIFVGWNVHKILGVHLIHGHLEMEQDHVMFGARFASGISGWWTRPVHLNEIAAGSVHGHIFALSEDHQLLPYEYREGPLPESLSKVPNGFFRAVIQYLEKWQLEGVLGLQILHEDPIRDQDMVEYVMHRRGTVMVDKKEVIVPSIFCYTGWTFDRTKDGTISCKGNEAHGDPGDGSHAIFTDGKPLTTFRDVLDLLVDEKIIASLH